MVKDNIISPFKLSMRQIPLVSVEKWHQVSEEARTSCVPLVIPGLFSNQSANWSPERIRTQFGNKEVGVVVDLPPHGVPYRESAMNYQKRMKLSDFIPMLQTGRSCYLNQAPINEYPELKKELDIQHLALGQIFAVNLWVGSKTRSGLHFDNADNLFGQIYGKKRALLVNPAQSRFLYPFADSPSKSQVDLDSPDIIHYPKLKRVEVWKCELNPGDALYIPRGWWHHISADDVSISINCWHGDSLSEFEYMRLFFAGGFRTLARAVYDFVWHGIFRRPYKHRLFSPEPPGIKTYNRIKMRHS